MTDCSHPSIERERERERERGRERERERERERDRESLRVEQVERLMTWLPEKTKAIKKKEWITKCHLLLPN